MSITLTNLLTNGDFESGWAVNSNCTIEFSTEQHLYGTKSLKVTSTNTTVTESLVNHSGNIDLVKGHKYYARCSIYVPNSLISSGMQCYWPIQEPKLGNLYKQGAEKSLESSDVNKWTQLSCINVRDNWDSGSYSFRFDVENIISPNYVYLDGGMLIDLTACYGAGHEPSRNTMDMIPFFVGTYRLPPYGIYLKANNKWTCIREYNY